MTATAAIAVRPGGTGRAALSPADVREGTCQQSGHQLHVRSKTERGTKNLEDRPNAFLQNLALELLKRPL